MYNGHMKEPQSSFAALFDLIGVLARRRFQAGERAFASLGLNHTEARLLTLLRQKGGEATQEALSNMLSVDRSNAGRALKNLEAKGYVVRAKDDEDGRTRMVNFTPTGEKQASEIARLRAGMAERFFGDLREEEAAIVVDLLRRAAGTSEEASR